jgi:SH3 domain-containing YSC84-like protein 1
MVALARSRGLYAGVTLAGAALRPDEEANRAFYGKPASPGDILGGSIENPAGAPLRRLLAERSR